MVLGQHVELGLCVERIEVREMLLLGPSSFSLTLFSWLLALRGGSLSDPKKGQGVERFEGHLNIAQHLKMHKYANF